MIKNTRLFDYMDILIIPSILVTIKIVVISAILSVIAGLFFGTVLFLTDKDGLTPNRIIHEIIDKIINLIRAFPTLILIVAIAPITRFVVGTMIGSNAAIFAITIACSPFATRMTESSFRTVDKDIINAAVSFGASKFQIISKVVLVDSLPNLISNFTIMLINMLNMTALAGAVGAGGLGAVALTYGYQSFDYAIMYFIVAILILFVLFIEKMSSILYKKLK